MLSQLRTLGLCDAFDSYIHTQWDANALVALTLCTRVAILMREINERKHSQHQTNRCGIIGRDS